MGLLKNLGAVRNQTQTSLPEEWMEKWFEEPVRLDQRRHGGRVNLSFCDGHVEQRRTLDLANPDMIPNWDRNED